MTDLVERWKPQLVPCGMTLGFGESCCKGHMCDGCREIERLQAREEILLSGIAKALVHDDDPRKPLLEALAAL